MGDSVVGSASQPLVTPVLLSVAHLDAGWSPPHKLHTCVCQHLGYVHPPAFHLRHGSPDGLRGGKGGVFCRGFVFPTMASTADSMALRRSRMSGSGSPRSAHLHSVWLLAKHNSHRFVPDAMPVKHMIYRVELITDQQYC